MFTGVFHISDEKATSMTSGFRCVNPKFQHPNYWGAANHSHFLACILNALKMLRRLQCGDYYYGLIIYDDPNYGFKKRQLSVLGSFFIAWGCKGLMKAKFTKAFIDTLLKYLDVLFDVNLACKQLEQFHQVETAKKELLQGILPLYREFFGHLNDMTQNFFKKNVYNWVAPYLWKSLFGTSERMASQ